ncbi:hypothetical protein SLE2022_142510 [Rubroshorea leprosula]
MLPNCFLIYLRKNTLIDELVLHSEAKCLTLEAGNKILFDYLEPFGKADYLTSPDKLPTLHKAQLALTCLESL